MTSTNLLANGEVSPNRLLAVKEHFSGEPEGTLTQRCAHGMHGVVEDGMVGKWCELSRESLRQAAPEFMTNGPKNRRPQEVRASIVAEKRSNARRVKGCRKMEAR